MTLFFSFIQIISLCHINVISSIGSDLTIQFSIGLLLNIRIKYVKIFFNKLFS